MKPRIYELYTQLLNKFSSLLTNKNRRLIPALLVIVTIASIGIYSLAGSHAATLYTNTEAESGNLAGGACRTNNSTAKDGYAVVFGGSACGSNKAPATPTAKICADSSILNGPSSPPAGAITIPAGDNSNIDATYELSANTVYWLAPGMHTLGTGQFGQFQPDTGDTFIGAPGAILSGQGLNEYAFTGTSTNVTIENLTIENFIAGTDAIVVNHDGGANWTIQDNTITLNTGAGVGLGTNDVINQNCLTENDQYGFSSFGGSTNDTLTNNEISYNDTKGTYDQNAYVVSYSVTNNVATIVTKGPMNLTAGHTVLIGNATACGQSWCTNLSDSALNGSQTIASVISSNSFTFNVTTPNVATTNDTAGTVADSDVSEGAAGGGKFWDTQGATVTGNYVHDNGNVGLWPDTDNTGFNISDNYISNNWAEGIIYEVSYNAQITNNTLIDNTWGGGPSPAVAGFPDSALYISESGADSRVNTSYNTQFLVSGNVFTNNWSGVVLWENSNRYCSDGSDTYCTLVDPNTYTSASCAASLSEKTPTDYYDNCRWKTQNVLVTNNTFNFDPTAIGSDCAVSDYCGFNGLFSNYGSAPYTQSLVPTSITFNQNDLFSNNTYTGPWNFDAWNQGLVDSFATWSAAVTDKCGTSGEIQSGQCSSGFGQDTGSSFN